MNRKNLVAAMAFALTLSAPMAFAQEAAADPAEEQAAQPADPATESADATAAAEQAAQPASPAQPAAPAEGADNRITWSDLDADKDGSLTKEEASSVQALSQVFDDADADKDGALTPDEYKAFVAQQSQAAGQPGSEG